MLLLGFVFLILFICFIWFIYDFREFSEEKEQEEKKLYDAEKLYKRSYHYRNDDDEQFENDHEKLIENIIKYKKSEYERVMKDKPFLVNLKTHEVILPHMLLKDEELNGLILEYIDKVRIPEMNVDQIIDEQLEQYNYYPSKDLFERYDVDEFEKYINPEYSPFNYLIMEDKQILNIDYVLINQEELTERENDDKFIKLFNGFDNYLKIKKTVKDLLLTEEEYKQYKKYIEELRDVKIKTKVDEYYNQSLPQSHTDHLIQIEQEINKIKKL